MASWVGWSSIVLVLGGCCWPSSRGDRYAALEEAYVHHVSSWSEVSWGRHLREEEREDARAVVRCLWDGLAARGVDPEADLACTVRRFEASDRCFRESPIEECFDVFEQTCATSEAFEEVTGDCQTLALRD